MSPSEKAALSASSVSRLTVELGTITMLSRFFGSGGVRPSLSSPATSA